MGTTQINRKPLADAGSCGVRLGTTTRSVAEQIAWSRGLCLSHWIRQLVEERIAETKRDSEQNSTTSPENETEQRKTRTKGKPRNSPEQDACVPAPKPQRVDAVQSALDHAFTNKMKELNR